MAHIPFVLPHAQKAELPQASSVGYDTQNHLIHFQTVSALNYSSETLCSEWMLALRTGHAAAHVESFWSYGHWRPLTFHY